MIKYGWSEGRVDVITIVVMFTIVAIIYDCRSTNNNCRYANHNCHHFFENLFDHVNINTWLEDGVSSGFLDLNPTFHNFVNILPVEIAQYILLAYTLSAETKFGFIFRHSPNFL